MKKLFWFVIAFVIIIGFVLLALSKWSHVSQTSSVGADIKNGTYIVDGTRITLANGTAETADAPGSASKTTTQYFGNEAVGDLNGDGIADTALLLAQSSSGTGTFYFVTVALAENGGSVGTNAIFLGDRIAPQTTEIKDGIITVNYADRAAGEPMAAEPSVGVSRYFKISSSTLVEIKAQ